MHHNPVDEVIVFNDRKDGIDKVRFGRYRAAGKNRWNERTKEPTDTSLERIETLIFQMVTDNQIARFEPLHGENGIGWYADIS